MIVRIIDAFIDWFDESFWDFRQLPYSYEHHKMMSNPVDREGYLNALQNLRNGSESETFRLESGEEVTIC